MPPSTANTTAVSGAAAAPTAAVPAPTAIAVPAGSTRRMLAITRLFATTIAAPVASL